MSKKTYDLAGKDRQEDSFVKLSLNTIASKTVISGMIFFMVMLFIIAILSGMLLILNIEKFGGFAHCYSEMIFHFTW